MAQPHRQMLSLMKLTSLRATLNKAGTEAKVRIPGFTADDFDRTGNLSVVRLQRLLTLARFYAYHTPNPESGKSFLEYDTLTKDKYTFMASTLTSVDRDYYTLPDQPDLPSLAIRVRLGYVGQASLNSVAELVDDVSGQVFATNTNQVVMVDKATRKPTPLPSWWRQLYKDSITSGGTKLVVGFVTPPSDDRCHNYVMKVSWNDIDAYKHTNYIAYVRFCLDAAMDAQNAGFFTHLSEDMLLYPVEKMEISYKGESLAGQELVVKCWESPDDPFTVHFDISRQGEAIFQNTIQFYRPQSVL